jgi:predicted DNA-binding transcriptional regulator AlpA
MIRTSQPVDSRSTYAFTLILAGVSEICDALQDALFEAGCDDALLGCRDGVVFLDFDREASSFREAALSAIADAQKVGCEVARIEPDELVTASQIAQRIHRSRENVRQFILGTRGPGAFPPPVAGLKGRSPLWRWAEVADWLTQKKAERSMPWLLSREVYETITTLNDALDLLRHVADPRAAAKLVRTLGRLRKNPIRNWDIPGPADTFE